MISIKRFLDQRGQKSESERNYVESLVQVVGLLLDGTVTHAVRGRETDLNILRRTLQGLSRQVAEPQSPMAFLAIGSDAVDALEAYNQSTTEYLRQEREQFQSIVSMLTDTVAELSGQTDTQVARLQAIERNLESASGLNDVRAVRANLQNCLVALREAAAHERTASAATMQRIRDHIDRVRGDDGQQPVAEGLGAAVSSERVPSSLAELVEPPADNGPGSYVAAFKLQRADSISSRFGEPVKQQMLAAVGSRLKTVLGPEDRLLRWKGSSFVMFITSNAPVREIKAHLAQAVAATGKQYFEMGSKSAMLAVGVDWFLFPQPEQVSLETVFAEVEAFLANGPEALSPAIMQR